MRSAGTMGILMSNPGTTELFLYWNRLRDGKPAPLRTQIEPVDIRTHLADTFILEQGMRKDVTFRLAGTRVCAIYGRELKDYAFLSLFSLGDMGLIKRLVNACFAEKTVSMITFDGVSRGRRVLGFDAIFMPLANTAESTRLFGALFPKEKPFWLGADPIVESRVTSVRVIDPDKELVFLNNRPRFDVPPMGPSLANISGPQSIGRERRAPERRFGHLTVISGGLSENEPK
jgi:hypothetical protein